MIIRPLSPADEGMLASWWIGWGKPIITAPMWPKVGLVVDEAVAGFLLQTDTRLAYIEWIISNPQYDKIKRKEAFNALLAALEEEAKRLGYLAVAGLATARGVSSACLKRGWKIDSTGVTALYKGLN